MRAHWRVAILAAMASALAPPTTQKLDDALIRSVMCSKQARKSLARGGVDVAWVDEVPVALGSWRRSAVDGENVADRYLGDWLSQQVKKEDGG